MRQAYYAWFGNTFQDRSSWDQVAVLYGVRGNSSYFEEIDTGNGQLSNGFQWKMEPGRRMYLVNKLPTTEMAKIIEALMVQPPMSGLFGGD